VAHGAGDGLALTVGDRPGRVHLSRSLHLPRTTFERLPIPAAAQDRSGERFQLALGLIERGMHDDAARQLQLFVREQAEHRKAAEAHYRLGVCYLELQQSEKAVAALYGLPLTALIDMGDFVGGMLKYLRTHPIPKLSVAGGIGKLAKLVAGHMDLHSKRSQVDPAFLAGLAERMGASPKTVAALAALTSAGAILQRATAERIAIGDAVAEVARTVCLKQADGAFDVEILVYDRLGQMVGRAGFASS